MTPAFPWPPFDEYAAAQVDEPPPIPTTPADPLCPTCLLELDDTGYCLMCGRLDVRP